MGYKEGFTETRNFFTNPHMDTPPEISKVTGKKWRDKLDVNGNERHPFYFDLEGKIKVYDAETKQWKIIEKGRIISTHNSKSNTSNQRTRKNRRKRPGKPNGLK